MGTFTKSKAVQSKKMTKDDKQKFIFLNLASIELIWNKQKSSLPDTRLILPITKLRWFI